MASNNSIITKILSVASIDIAVNILKANKPVAIPTETVYGLAANALSEEACRQIFEAKGRPRDNPLIVHISDLDMLNTFVETSKITADTWKLCEKFWPGPLTLLLPRKARTLPDIVLGGSASAAYYDTVAVRMPSHPIALEIIRKCGFPLAAPSANTSGKPSPTMAEHVYQDMSGKIEAIVDGGKCTIGLESTVLDSMRQPPLILRPGGLSYEVLKQHLPDLQVYKKEVSQSNGSVHEDLPSTPGMKYRHYSPNAQVVLFLGDKSNQRENICKFIKNASQAGSTMVFLQINHPECEIYLDDKLATFVKVINLGTTMSEIAANLFAALRDSDSFGVDFVIVQAIPHSMEGLAIMNRLEKAASQIVP